MSEELHAVAHEPKRLLVFPGGHHRSLQHDLEVQNVAARFIRSAFADRSATGLGGERSERRSGGCKGGHVAPL